MMTTTSYDNATFSSCDAFLTDDVVYCALTTSDAFWKTGMTEHQTRPLVVKTCADCHATALTSATETETKIFFVVEILMLVC